MVRGSSLGAALLVVAVSPVVLAQHDHDVEMTVYQLVLLREGSNRTPIGERGIQALQEEHLTYLDRLHRANKLLIEGPISRGGQLRSVLVLDVVDAVEARMDEEVRPPPLVSAHRTRVDHELPPTPPGPAGVNRSRRRSPLESLR